ncbi:MAG TPA: hypothetical protein VGG38_06095 [Acidimicrobiales bacterium]|jgi:hypothetical protein
MRARVLIPAAVVAALGFVLAGVGSAGAADTGGENTFANAQASGGQLTVQAGVTHWTPPSDSAWAKQADSDPPPGKANPNQPYGCTYTAAPSLTAAIGAGGAQPGEWMDVECSGPGVIDPMPPIWVSNATQAAAQIDPAAVAQQAVKQLAFGTPSIEMAPPDGSPQLVSVATWLWLDPDAWQTLTATANAGTVTATATATPSKVIWNMGDGDSVTCDGPGTPYSSSDPNATTDCSYTWPQAGSYTVTATVYWSVTWTAVGAAGGGDLGLQAGPAAEVPVTVTESQAINTLTGGSD